MDSIVNRTESMTQAESMRQEEYTDRRESMEHTVGAKQADCARKAAQRPETGYSRILRENYTIFGIGAFLYGCFYAFCMFRNPSGITYPFFVAGSLGLFCWWLQKLGLPIKKGSWLYMGAAMLLAVSCAVTGDVRIRFFNKAGILLLITSMLLTQMYATKGWELGKYLSAIARLWFMSVGELAKPFTHTIQYIKDRVREKNSKNIYVLIGILLTLPVFFVILVLLSSADAIFRGMTERLLEMIRPWDVVQVMLMIFWGFGVTYCVFSYYCKQEIGETVKDKKLGEPIVAGILTGSLSAMYLVFSVIQLLSLFLGKMTLPQGYTYAMYAREGFFQLLAVGIINFLIVMGVLSFFRESKAVKCILFVMSICTFIMIASSALRMIIYIQYYYLTFLRLLVLWALGLLALLFAGIVCRIWKKEFPLFVYCCTVVTCMYIGLSYSRPDYWIARVNLSAAEETKSSFFAGDETVDFWYLSQLGSDAAPAIADYLKEEGVLDVEGAVRFQKNGGSFYYVVDWEGESGKKNLGKVYLGRMSEELENHRGIRRWNLSWHMADMIMGKH